MRIVFPAAIFDAISARLMTFESLKRLAKQSPLSFASRKQPTRSSTGPWAYLAKEKIHLLCAHGKGTAGYSVILDTLEHDRTILTYKGINDLMRHDELPYKKLKTKWFYFCAMMNESFHTMERLAEFAEQNKIKIAFNPSSYLAEKGINHLKHIISRTEILVLNKDEAKLLVGEGSAEEHLSKLRELGPKIVVITDGKNEIYVSYGKTIFSARPPLVKVVDATGAGDAFASSFLSGIIRKNDIEFAIKFGIVNSYSVITHYGAKNILLGFKEAMKEIKKLKVKIHKRKIN